MEANRPVLVQSYSESSESVGNSRFSENDEAILNEGLEVVSSEGEEDFMMGSGGFLRHDEQEQAERSLSEDSSY